MGRHWAGLLMVACYLTLAGAAFVGGHQAVVVGCCYLVLAALVAQAHK